MAPGDPAGRAGHGERPRSGGDHAIPAMLSDRAWAVPLGLPPPCLRRRAVVVSRPRRTTTRTSSPPGRGVRSAPAAHSGPVRRADDVASPAPTQDTTSACHDPGRAGRVRLFVGASIRRWAAARRGAATTAVVEPTEDGTFWPRATAAIGRTRPDHLDWARGPVRSAFQRFVGLPGRGRAPRPGLPGCALRAGPDLRFVRADYRGGQPHPKHRVRFTLHPTAPRSRSRPSAPGVPTRPRAGALARPPARRPWSTALVPSRASGGARRLIAQRGGGVTVATATTTATEVAAALAGRLGPWGSVGGVQPPLQRTEAGGARRRRFTMSTSGRHGLLPAGEAPPRVAGNLIVARAGGPPWGVAWLRRSTSAEGCAGVAPGDLCCPRGRRPTGLAPRIVPMLDDLDSPSTSRGEGEGSPPTGRASPSIGPAGPSGGDGGCVGDGYYDVATVAEVDPLIGRVASVRRERAVVGARVTLALGGGAARSACRDGTPRSTAIGCGDGTERPRSTGAQRGSPHLGTLLSVDRGRSPPGSRSCRGWRRPRSPGPGPPP